MLSRGRRSLAAATTRRPWLRRAGIGTAIAVVAGAVFVTTALPRLQPHGSTPPAPTSSGGGAAGTGTEPGSSGSRFGVDRSPSSGSLPPATTTPDPAPTALATAAPLAAHEVFGFAPHWMLGAADGFDLRSLTTIAYFSVEVGADGSLSHSGDGWTGYLSAPLSALVSRAHHANARVVLTASVLDNATIHQLVHDAAALHTFTTQLVDAVRARNMDGANLDLEGDDNGDRAALTSFVSQTATALHAANPHWQLTVDVYASSAADPNGYFDIRAMAPAVDAFFVMAYDMHDRRTVSPTAPLDGYAYSDNSVAFGFADAVPPSKVILGAPLYGEQWPTTGGDLHSPATGPVRARSYASLVKEHHPRYWDEHALVAWTSFQDGSGQWFVAYYDDPESLALKGALAALAQLGGVGVWALGMDGNDPAMLQALTRATPGGSPPPDQQLPTLPPPSTPRGSSSPGASGPSAAPAPPGLHP